MQFVWRLFIRYVPLIFLVVVLAACSGQEPESTVLVVAASPTAFIEPGTATPTPTPAVVDPVGTVETSARASTETPEPTEEPAQLLFNGIAHGLTDAGFPYLGDPDAPVTVIDYSDFL